MFDVEKLLGQMLSGGMGGGKRERRSASTFGLPGVSKAQLGVGAIGIAIAAWEHYKSKSGAPPAAPMGAPQPAAAMPPPPPPPPMRPPQAAPSSVMPAPPPAVVAAAAAVVEVAQPATAQADATHLIRAMIATANADGLIDAEERAGILERAMEAGLDAATQQFLMGELRAPASMDEIVAATRPELRLETYAASLIAISIDSDAERAYLDRLAAALGLSPDDRARVAEQIGA